MLGGKECSAIAETLRRALRAADTKRQPVDELARATVDEIVGLALEWRTACSARGSADVRGVTDGVEPVIVEDDMDATETATILECTAHNVRDRARRGTLPGRHTARGWRFDRHTIATHAAERRTRAAEENQ